MRSTIEAIHITVDHGGWCMPACGLLGSHMCLSPHEIGGVDPNRICPMCVAAEPSFAVVQHTTSATCASLTSSSPH
jgi:hypothetical protein